MKQIVLLLFLILSWSLSCFAQETPQKTHDKKVNFGIKGGFNTAMYFIDEFKIKDITIDEIQNNYKVGYFGAMFLRINMNKHFIEPELAYHVSKCEILFDKKGSQHPDIEPDYASINSTIHAFELPVLYGYNFIKNGPYGMSFFMGPKLKYIWNKKSKLEFSNFDQKGIKEELYPLNINAVAGVGVNISNIIFDFRYEVGLMNISKSVTYVESNTDGSESVANMIFKRRSNLLSFSLGVIF
ncbi:porin family protein [uncultured Bacteroides sp.]|uniref:porin family protein n=1 Tax=uncultured Bacteroides sp. TaxID=162156 RepID=UPI002AABD349|nr:porin family protein [uncultured Bacteroides sp.]